MATNFPTSLDSFTNPTAVDTLDSPPHDTQHADANDAIEALEAKVGVDGSAVTTSHEYRINAIEELDISNQTASYTLVLSDAGKLVSINSSSANDLTIPAQASVDFPIGTQILFVQLGTGQTTLVPDTGVTLRSKDGNRKLSARYCGVTLIKRTNDDWYAIGDLTA